MAPYSLKFCTRPIKTLLEDAASALGIRGKSAEGSSESKIAHDVSLVVASLVVFPPCFPLKRQHWDCWLAHICLLIEAARSIDCDSWGRRWQQAAAVRNRFTLVTLAKLHVYTENLSRLSCEDNVREIDWGGRIGAFSTIAGHATTIQTTGNRYGWDGGRKTRPLQR